MSDSELSEFSPGEAPTDQALEESLRQEVRKYFQTGDVSVNYARKASEETLQLKKNFYINHPKWKAESKRIIKDEVEKQEALPSPAKPPLRLIPSPPVKRAIVHKEEPPRKKQKTATPSEDEAELSSPLSVLSSEEDKPKRKTARNSNGNAAKSEKPTAKNAVAKAKPKRKAKKQPDLADQSSSDEETIAKTKTKKEFSEPPPKPAVDSESELSELVDDDPKPKRRKSKEVSDKKGEKSKKPKAKADTDDDPDTAEIKRLQGWLVKCGIRKLWGKELKPYQTPKAKIKRLKDMLADAGMTGRYSQEKATQIKEQRELAADIEAVQEGAERWGKDDEESDGEDKTRSGRRLVRGSKAYDFLSSDGEETD